MADRGARYADKKLSEIDRELRKVYKQAQKELTEKLSDFNKQHRKKDREKRQQMDKGEISKQQYKDWLAGQVFMRGQWERKLDQVNQVMLHHNEQAMRIINDSRLDVFAENYYSEGFKAKWIIQDVGFNVYSTHAIARLLEKQPQILPKWKIDEEKDYKWNEKKVNNIIQQGIIQGESVDQIGKRLCEDLSSQNESKMTMFARTAITGAQNAGRQVQMEQAAAAGIKVNKRWIATLDNRTRDLHRARDGEEVPYDEEFSGGIEYPGDPTAPPEEVYNCRCTMETVYPEYADRSKEWREDETIDGVPYEEWKEEAKQRLEEKAERNARNNSSGIPKEKGKELEKYVAKRKPQSDEDKKQVALIAKRLQDEGFLAKGSKANIAGVDLGLAKGIMTAFERMCDKFPELKGRVRGIDLVSPTMFKNPYAFANCNTFSGGNIRLNSLYYTNPALFEKAYNLAVKVGAFPKETTKESVIYHELAHALDGVLTKESNRNPSDSYSKMIKELVMNEKDADGKPKFTEESIGTRIGTSAVSDKPYEWYANCVSIMMTVDRSKRDEMVNVFESFVMNTESGWLY